MKAGDRYGTWTVLDPYVGGQRAFCRCACGRELKVARPNLISGASKRCRKCQGQLTRQRFQKCLLGKRFGCLTVTRDDDWQGPERWRRRVEAVCKRCKRTCVISVPLLRERPSACTPCRIDARIAETLATPHAVTMTGLTRQGIHQRIERGWTRQEAQTLPKGATPERLRRLRSAA